MYHETKPLQRWFGHVLVPTGYLGFKPPAAFVTVRTGSTSQCQNGPGRGTGRTDQVLHAESGKHAYRIDDSGHLVTFIWVELTGDSSICAKRSVFGFTHPSKHSHHRDTVAWSYEAERQRALVPWDYDGITVSGPAYREEGTGKRTRAPSETFQSRIFDLMYVAHALSKRTQPRPTDDACHRLAQVWREQIFEFAERSGEWRIGHFRW